MKTSIVTGAGGFIGFHLVNLLKKKGHTVTGIDIKYPEFGKTKADFFVIADLRDPDKTKEVIRDADELYMLAADMGGMGYIDHVHAPLMRNNTLITINSLEAARINAIKKVFFASSACVYPLEKQQRLRNYKLKEHDAIPAHPDTAYGWEKLYSELLCQAYAKDHNMEMFIARFHNIYGPYGVYEGGREKSPAALCRKIALAKKKDVITVWGDGKQTRSYCYVSDCCEGVLRLMESNCHEPVNIGTDRAVTVEELVRIIAAIAKKDITCVYDLDKPQGVRERNADITLVQDLLGWMPVVSLESGLKKTYKWIESKITFAKKK